MVNLDYRDSRPIYTQIGENIRSQILQNILQSGDRLPSVRELASQLAINPNTIQRAYRELELAGWIVTVPGKGCFVCPRGQQDEDDGKYAAFDKAVQVLLQAGVSRQDLIDRITQGGNDHA